MANALWGKVYYKDTYAGRLQEEAGGRCIFTYDTSYLEAEQPKIAHTLPLRKEPHISEQGLHSFFDNLVAEGWFRNAQARALGIDPRHRFALLLGFGHDLAGAVSVVDPEPRNHYSLDHADDATIAALLGRASLSGIQRKLLVVREGNGFRPVQPNELSTHIAKLSSGNLRHLIELEFLTTLVVRELLPDDEIVDMEITNIPAINEQALIVPRFDRTPTGRRLYHFEEFNQLLGRRSGDDKYEGGYEDIAKFIRETPDCISAEVDRLFRRILACLLVGNTDAHFKNFAMFHTRDGLRLTPMYDLVSAAIYPEYQSIALYIAGIRNLKIGALLPKHLLMLGKGFGLDEEDVVAAVETLGKHLPIALETLAKADVGPDNLKKKLIEKVEKRWNGSFALTGQLLSSRRSKGASNKN